MDAVIGVVLLAMLAGCVLGLAAMFFGMFEHTMFGDLKSDLRSWSHERKRLEADSILKAAREVDDAWRVDHEARR